MARRTLRELLELAASRGFFKTRLTFFTPREILELPCPVEFLRCIINPRWCRSLEAVMRLVESAPGDAGECTCVCDGIDSPYVYNCPDRRIYVPVGDKLVEVKLRCK